MAMFKCPKCGKSYEVETMCCNEEMDRADNALTCDNCGNEVEIPSCCGQDMEIAEG